MVPHSLRADMLKEIHRSHRGIGGCLRRARELLYWPRINAEVKDYVSKCSVCQSYQPEQCREELQPHEMPSCPWSKVGADIFELGPQQFMIMVDYWSSYFEVQELKRITSESVIHALKVQFARHGIPEVLVTDNDTQFSSSEFAKFAETGRFEHKTSSPCYPQSNGKAENAVKVWKALLKKAGANNKDPLLAFLDWRNIPSEGLGTSPIQRLMGRRTRTLLPTHTKLLEPKVDSQTADKLAQKVDTKSQPLTPLQPVQAIRMKLPGDTKWSLGRCVKILPNRSYEVEVAGRCYRHNRHQLRTTAETPPPPSVEQDLPHNHPQTAKTTKPPSTSHDTELAIDHDQPVTVPATVTSQPAVQLRRSSRIRKTPAWHDDDVMNT